MDNKPIEYPSGQASLFHAHATEAPEPIRCENCNTRTAEFWKDFDVYEIYVCTRCGCERRIAVR